MVCKKCGKEIPEEARRCPSCKAKVASQKDDPLLGKTLADKYILTKKLGEGSFGAVYEAEEPQLGRKVAIKTLHPHLNRKPQVVERFRREGMAAGRLEHPCAVKIYDNGETEDHRFWIAMELLVGEPLDEYLLKKGTLPPEEFLQIIGPVCEVLAEAHDKGIIHRDLKPQNIFVVTSGETLSAKPLDFGISKVLEADSMTQSGIMMGTPAYMSPEQWEGAKHATPASDIYALGVIAYQALSGKLPFEADTAASWMRHHCFTKPTNLDRVLAGRLFPPRLGAVVMKALEKSPSARYATTLEFLEAFKEAATEPPVVLAPKEDEEDKSRKASRAASTLVLEVEEPGSGPEEARAEAPSPPPSSEAHDEPESPSPPPKEEEAPPPKEASGSGFLRTLGVAGGAVALLVAVFFASGLSSSLFSEPTEESEASEPTPETAPAPTPPSSPPRFLVHGDGTVTDTQTGLMWAEEDSKKGLTLEEAKQYCKNFDKGGYNDWRMPTREELMTLYTREVPGHIPHCDRLRKDPEYEIHHYPEVKIGCYGFWTSDTKDGKNYVFSFQKGSTFLRPPTSKIYILPVRDAKGKEGGK